MRTKLVAILSAAGALRFAPGISSSDSPDRTKNFNLTCNGGSERCRLVSAQVLFRHGARTPVYEIPPDGRLVQEVTWDADLMTAEVPHTVVPYRLHDLRGNVTQMDQKLLAMMQTKSYLKGGAQTGTLTRFGKDDMYRFGRRLRTRYVDQLQFIGSRFSPDEVYCRSTHFVRTIDSARCVFAGLFPASEEEPVRIHICSPEEEVLVAMRFNCPWLLLQAQRMKPGNLNVKEISQLREETAALLGPDALKKKDGSDVQLYYIRDDIISRLYHGFPVAPELQSLLKKMERVCPTELAVMVIGPQKDWKTIGLRAGVGLLCQLIADNLAAGEGKGHPRLILYSTHDETLLLLMLALDLFDGLWPPFGADFALELCETPAGERWVIVRYCDRRIAEMPLHEMQKRLRAIATTPRDFRDVCAKK